MTAEHLNCCCCSAKPSAAPFRFWFQVPIMRKVTVQKTTLWYLRQAFAAKKLGQASLPSDGNSPPVSGAMAKVNKCLDYLTKHCSQEFLVEKALQPCGVRHDEFRCVDLDNKIKRTCDVGVQCFVGDEPPAKKAKVADEAASSCVDLTGDAPDADHRQDLVSRLMMGPFADEVCMMWQEIANEYGSHEHFLAAVAARFGA